MGAAQLDVDEAASLQVEVGLICVVVGTTQSSGASAGHDDFA